MRALQYATAVVVLLALLELTYSLFPEPHASPEHTFWVADQTLGWFHQRNAAGVFENQDLGFHSDVHFDARGLRKNGAVLPGPAERTVLIIGDSVVAGLEVNDAETLSALLERRLSAGGHPTRVINAGVRGYGTDQALILMQQLLPEVKPDLVIYTFAHNDLSDIVTEKNHYRVFGKPAFVIDDKGALKLMDSPVPARPKSAYEYVWWKDGGVRRISGAYRAEGALTWLHEHSRVYAAVEDLVYAHVVQAPAPTDLGAIDDEYVDRLFKGLLVRMRSTAPHLLVTAFTADRNGAQNKVDYVKEACRTLGMPFVDLRPAFTDPAGGYIVPEDGHWNAKGHAAAAAGLQNAVEAALAPARITTAAHP